MTKACYEKEIEHTLFNLVWLNVIKKAKWDILPWENIVANMLINKIMSTIFKIYCPIQIIYILLVAFK